MIERHTANRLHGLSSRKLLPAPNDLIAVDRVELDQARLPVGPFAGDKSRAAAAKAVEDEIAAAGAVPDGVGYERDRLGPGGHGQTIVPIPSHTPHPRI